MKDVEERKPFYTGGDVNWCGRLGKQYGGSSGNEKVNYHVIQQPYSARARSC